jgi:flagellar hook capping protein FlgD
MNHTTRNLVAAAVAAMVWGAAPAVAQDQNAGSPGEWLSGYTSARTLGLGGAYVATADDPLGVLWNPAGLSAMYQNELHFENAQMFEQTSINSFGFAVPGSWLPSFGITVLSMGSGDFQKTNEMNDPLGTFKDGETAYLFTVSRAFSPRLAVGTNLKLVQQSVEDFSAQGFGLDLGATYELTPTVKVGASMSNLGGPSLKLRDVAEPYPMMMRGGVAAMVLNGRGMVTAELDQSSGLGTRVHGGAEYWLQPMLGLRVGFDNSYGTGGISYRFAPQYQVDYAIADQDLGLTHRVGLSYRFGGFFASSKAEPEVFSPTGENAVTKINLNARTKSEPDVWTLDILSKSDEVVRRFSGKGQPPSHVQWDGKDAAGMPVPDGPYRYRLVVKDAAGREVLATMRVIVISTTGPQGTVPVIPVQPTTPAPEDHK